MSSYVTNKFVSRIDQSDYIKAISKLSYEIQHRKNEFLALCVKEDPNYKSRIPTNTFAEILNKFTMYPNDYEKKLIIHKNSINDKYIDYLNLVEYPRISKEPYQDIFLQHLNDERFKKYYEQKNILLTVDSEKKKEDNKKDEQNSQQSDNESDSDINFGLLPIEIAQAEINEENFLRKVSKDLMTYILTHTKGERPKEFTHKLFKKFDFDNDDKYTIGEFNNFLMACELILRDSDLRFFYENFPVIDGRVSINQINDFIEVNSEKNFKSVNVKDSMIKEKKTKIDEKDLLAKGIEEKLETQKKYQKKLEDQRIMDMTKKNYIFNTVKDCLLIFGRDYLMQYFHKYFFNFAEKPYIEDNSFLLGLCSFGYKMPSSLDIGNFKYVCIHKEVAKVRGLGHSLILDVEGLFDFIIGFFEIEETIKVRGAEELINNMGSTFHDKINETLLGMISDIKNKSENEETINENEININKDIHKKKIDEYLYKSIGEKDFRKKFINNFGFIDHKFFDGQIQQFCSEEIKGDKNFNPNLINAKKFVDFSYNFLFLFFLKNYQSLGILLDSSCHKILNELYSKIKNQIFPKQKKEHKNSIKYDENSPNIINTTKSIINTEENIKKDILKTVPMIKDKLEEEKADINIKSVNEYILNKKNIRFNKNK